MKRIPNLLRASVLSAAALLAGASDMRANLLRDPIYTSDMFTVSGTFVAESTISLVDGFTGSENISMAGTWDGNDIPDIVSVGPFDDNPTGFPPVFDTGNGDPSAILSTPEPATMVLIGSALVGIAIILRHRKTTR